MIRSIAPILCDSTEGLQDHFTPSYYGTRLGFRETDKCTLSNIGLRYQGRTVSSMLTPKSFFFITTRARGHV
jgi:hypothetical protein